jgi:Zn-dependent M28 family amino/carboxypeptidase
MCKACTLTLLFVLVALSCGLIGCAGSDACGSRTNDTQAKLLECVTVDGVRKHLTALQAIADDHGGNRAAGTSGYDASIAYVVDTLQDAGYETELHAFDFAFEPPASLQQIAPVKATYETGNIRGSGTGTVSGPVIPVDLALGEEPWPADPFNSTSGCEASDFDGLDFSGPSDIALLQQGACIFSAKASNAEKAGAEAVIFFVEEAFVYRADQYVGTAALLLDGSPSNLTIPLIGVRFPQSVALSQEGVEAIVDAASAKVVTEVNVLAELPGGESGEVVMVGAHLDSVHGTPGISDNGSGSAAILETAVQMSKVKPRNTVRFAWWGTGSDLIGSKAYVNGLSQEARDEIALYLNFDMIGSPNHGFFIFDGDYSDSKDTALPPAGSAEIEKLFESYYAELGLPFKSIKFSGSSDHGSFIDAGIPVGWLFTGAEGVKTEEEVELWGGTTGDRYDPCYHLACDTFDNINFEALDVNSDAVAYSVLQYAMNTEEVNGVRGKGNFQLDPGVGPMPSK